MADINDWMRGDGSDALKGTDPAYKIDDNTTNFLQDPLDRLLRNYIRNCGLAIASADVVTVGSGEVVCHNSALSARRFRVNDASVSCSTLDTGVFADNTMYYVYAVADADATTFTAIFSLSPNFPTGVSYARRLGGAYRGTAAFTYVYGESTPTSTRYAEDSTYITIPGTSGEFSETPLVTEGTPYTQLNDKLGIYTPKSAVSKLWIEVSVFGRWQSSGNSPRGYAVLFNGSTPVVWGYFGIVTVSTGACVGPVIACGEYSPGSTDPITFQLRVAARTTGYLNETSDHHNRLKCRSYIRITEMQA